MPIQIQYSADASAKGSCSLSLVQITTTYPPAQALTADLIKMGGSDFLRRVKKAVKGMLWIQ